MNWDEIFQSLRERFQDDWKEIAYELMKIIKGYRPPIPLSKMKLSEEKIGDIIRLAQQGKKAREISEELSIPLASVARYGKGHFVRKAGRPKEN